MIVLLTHVRTAKWASIMPAVLADTFRLSDRVSAVPIVEPDLSHVVGLVVPEREPMTPLCAGADRRGAERGRGDHRDDRRS